MSELGPGPHQGWFRRCGGEWIEYWYERGPTPAERAQRAIDIWQALPWYKRLWYLVVSAW